LVSVCTMLEKSRANTLAALNSSASDVPSTATIAKPSRPASIPGRSGAQPTTMQTVSRITICGMMWYADTSIEATGNISRGIAIFFTIDELRMIERVPAVNVSVK
jgi:hypothetical protein